MHPPIKAASALIKRGVHEVHIEAATKLRQSVHDDAQRDLASAVHLCGREKISFQFNIIVFKIKLI